MNAIRFSKLNRLPRLIPEGLIADAPWFSRQGFSTSLLRHYVARGWLDQPARGIYRRPVASLSRSRTVDGSRREDSSTRSGEALRWQQVVISLQNFLSDEPPIVGGRTAIEMHGYAHYLRPSDLPEIHLYGRAPLPRWVSRLGIGSRFIFHNCTRLFMDRPIARGLTTAKRSDAADTTASLDPLLGFSIGQVTWGTSDWPITVSTPERAVLELLDELPRRETFHQVDVLFEGLRTLSPRRLTKLLQDCRSVKVKRLFLWFAQRHDHPWLRHITRAAIDIGSGKRQIVPGGKLDPTYLITVPEEMHAER